MEMIKIHCTKGFPAQNWEWLLKPHPSWGATGRRWLLGEDRDSLFLEGMSTESFSLSHWKTPHTAGHIGSSTWTLGYVKKEKEHKEEEAEREISNVLGKEAEGIGGVGGTIKVLLKHIVYISEIFKEKIKIPCDKAGVVVEM